MDIIDDPFHSSFHDYPMVTLAQAHALAETRRTTATALSNGVALIVTAAAVLITTGGVADHVALTVNLPLGANAAPVAVILALIAWAVFIFINQAHAFAGLTHIIRGHFTRDPDVTAWAWRLRMEHERVRNRRLAIAVALWIMSAIPIIAIGVASTRPGANDYSSLGVGLALLIVALGLRIFLPANWAAATRFTLANQGGTHDAVAKKTAQRNPMTSALAPFYWTTCLVIFLAWSLLTDAWARSWIIWPLAAVLFAAIAAGESSLISWRRTRHTPVL